MSTEGTLEYQKSRAAKVTEVIHDLSDLSKTYRLKDENLFQITDWGMSIYLVRGTVCVLNKNGNKEKKAGTMVICYMSDAHKVIEKVKEVGAPNTDPLSDWVFCVEKILQELYPYTLFITLAPPKLGENSELMLLYDDIGVIREPEPATV